MTTNIVELNNKKQNTIIFVENSLIVLGICRILEAHNMQLDVLDLDKLENVKKQNSLFVTQVSRELMDSKAKFLIDFDQSSRLIIIKNKLDLHEVAGLIEIGVMGILSNQLDEEYLIHALKQVLLGNLFIENRFLNALLLDYKMVKKIAEQSKPVDSCALKELLTVKEYDVLILLLEGLSNKQIAERLSISERTIKNHVSKIIEKMEVKDRINAILKVLKNRWINI